MPLCPPPPYTPRAPSCSSHAASVPSASFRSFALHQYIRLSDLQRGNENAYLLPFWHKQLLNTHIRLSVCHNNCNIFDKWVPSARWQLTKSVWQSAVHLSLDNRKMHTLASEFRCVRENVEFWTLQFKDPIKCWETSCNYVEHLIKAVDVMISRQALIIVVWLSPAFVISLWMWDYLCSRQPITRVEHMSTGYNLFSIPWLAGRQKADGNEGR